MRRYLCCVIFESLKLKNIKDNFCMASITQGIRYRLSLINYVDKHGVTKVAIKYKTNWQYFYPLEEP